jgi:endo-1,4-beta-mannosidase
MVYFVKGYSDETINGKLRVLVRLLPIKWVGINKETTKRNSLYKQLRFVGQKVKF